MSAHVPPNGDGYGDPTSQPFWEAACERRLVVQHCASCDHHQFYPRPFCLACGSPDVGWVQAAGTGTVYSQTQVHIPASQFLEPPYVCALVELDEGPRLLTNITGSSVAIGDRVAVDWRDREDAPPLPVFRVSQPLSNRPPAT